MPVAQPRYGSPEKLEKAPCQGHPHQPQSRSRSPGGWYLAPVAESMALWGPGHVNPRWGRVCRAGPTTEGKQIWPRPRRLPPWPTRALSWWLHVSSPPHCASTQLVCAPATQGGFAGGPPPPGGPDTRTFSFDESMVRDWLPIPKKIMPPAIAAAETRSIHHPH